MAAARDDLVNRLVADVAINGLADRSLRELAASVGTSHRMLLYHFESRRGLVAAVVERVEADQRAMLAELAATATNPADLIRALWRRVTQPEVLPFVALFFETVGHRASSDLTRPWIDESVELAEGLGVVLDPSLFRVGVAVTRGLLVDVLLTGDVDTATRSLESFIELLPL